MSRTRLWLLALLGVLIGIGIAVPVVLLSRGPRRGAPMPTVVTVRRRPPKRHRVQRALALPTRPPNRTITLPILMYHRIDLVQPTLPEITQRLTVDPRDFSAQMRWLKRHGFHAVTQLQAFDALERGGRLPSRPIMITFDDGYRDVLVNASPVLQRLHMPATAYIITDRLGGVLRDFLTWRQLDILERRGFSIGSHTVSHPDLTTLDDTQAWAQLRRSRSALQRHLGHPVQWFAYPAGAENARVVALARRAGYVLAVTTLPGDRQSGADPLELHRYEILDTTGVAGVAALLGAG